MALRDVTDAAIALVGMAVIALQPTGSAGVGVRAAELGHKLSVGDVAFRAV